MKMVSKIALGAAAMLALSGGAMATDFGIPAPDEVMFDWSGVYAGATANYLSTGYAGLNGVLGVNFLPAENFLLGLEGTIGYNWDVGGGGGNDWTATVAVRAGIVAGPALIYATGGEWVQVSVGTLYPFVGGGVEFAAGDSASIRLQGVYYTTTGNTDVSAGILWHMH